MSSIRKRGKFADDVDVGNVADSAERRRGAKDHFVLDAAVWRHLMPESLLGKALHPIIFIFVQYIKHYTRMISWSAKDIDYPMANIEEDTILNEMQLQ